MKAIIFDMDGVLVDAMPFHYQAMKSAVKEVTSIDLDKRTFYLLEGMPVEELALEIFKLKGYLVDDSGGKKDNISSQKSEEIAKRKKQLFKEMNIIPKPYDGVRELISNDLTGCLKAVVSGAAKQEVDAIMEQNFGKDNFDLIMNGDEFEGKGKPDPAPFKVALERLNLDNNKALVVENAPLGIKSANNAGIQSIVTLNTSPLATGDFKDLIPEDRIFIDTKSAGRFLKNWCNSDH
ncbi:MAG TPA: HAD-IA family hydrolase [Nitrososphaeraceae archaeon]|jgi:beta-phosphoglucomutase-like phosphatase (HAD superfamily)